MQEKEIMSIAQTIKDKIYEVKPKYFSHGEVIRHLIHSRVEHYVLVDEAVALNKPKEEMFPAIFQYSDNSLLIVTEYNIKVASLKEDIKDNYNPYEDISRVDE